MVILGSRFALQIAAQDNELAAEKALQSDRIVNGKQLAEAQLDRCRIMAGQNLAAKREVKSIHPRARYPLLFL